jgi:chorismate mutase
MVLMTAQSTTVAPARVRPSRQAWRRFHAVRGATTVAVNDPDDILCATRELLGELTRRNRLEPDEIVSILFSVTQDLTSAFPARAARELGWSDVPLLCMTEIPVPEALPRCIRIMLHVELDRPRGGLAPVYLRDAEGLRPDLVT